MKYTISDVGKGLNLDLLPSELPPGFVSSATNVRFRNGFAERVNGIQHLDASFLTPYHWLSLYPIAAANPYDCFMVYVTDSVAYAWNFNATHTNITRYTEGAVISSITRAGTTATLTTLTNHGRSNGDSISVWGASPSQYNGTYTITVTGATTFTYTMASDPGASASPVGLYSYNGATSNFTSSMSAPRPQQYTGGVFNGIFILNSPADGLYYWNGDTALRLRKMPTSYKARVSRAFGNYIVQLAPTISGTEYPYRVVWSAATEPGSIPSSFEASATNDAGFVDLAQSGEMVDCLPLGNTLIIYTTNARYAMSYVGGNDVFSFTKLPGDDGLLYRGCVCDTPVGHVFLSNNMAVMQHSGGACRNLSAGRVSSGLTGNYSSLIERSFVFKSPEKHEVWVCYPSATSPVANYCDKVLMWNWVDDTWGTKTLTAHGLSCGVSGVPGTLWLREAAYVTANDSGGTRGRIGWVENDYLDFVTSFNSVVELKGMDIGDRDTVKNLQRSRLNFDYFTGGTYTVQVQHGSSMFADVAPTYQSAVTYTLGTTDYANSRATGGRFVAVKITWSAQNSTMENSGKLRSIDLDVTGGGKR
jgi:hypothetical protein